MIDTNNAKWDFSPEEKYVIKWFNDNGFDGELVKQYVSKTKFTVRKNGVSDKFELLQGFKHMDIVNYMEQYKKSFDMLCELQAMKESLSKMNKSLNK